MGNLRNGVYMSMPGKKIAFLFPGQGSQSVGMGRDLVTSFPKIKQIFDDVDEICGKSISRLCFEGPMEELTITENLQPAVTAANLACLRALKESGVHPQVSAGHSLGEYAALVSVGVVSPYDALRLVQKRGQLMQREAIANPGSMMAVIGMGWDAVSEVVTRVEAEGVVSIANHNTAAQIVITGETAALSQAVQLIKEKGGKAIPLRVSGAWHCKLMEGAVGEFRRFLEDVTFFEPQTEMLFNATAGNESDPEKIKDLMAEQLINPVRWYEIVLEMLQKGVHTFVEVGPKRVLSGLVKKIVPSGGTVKIYNVEGLESLKDFLKEN